MKSRLVRAELFRADAQTDRHDYADSSFFIILQTHLKMTADLSKIWLNSNVWGRHQEISITFTDKLMIGLYQSFHILFSSLLVSET